MFKKICLASSVAAIALSTVASAKEFPYGEALQKSLYFYEAQQAGPLPDWNRVSWRGDSVPDDGADVGLDLRGGWFDAGDHVKFGYPMAATTTVVAWGGVDYAAAYSQSGQMKHLLNNLRFVNDFFINAHPSPNVLYGQIGLGNADHNFWGAAEVVHHKIPSSRVSMKIDSSCPGTDLAAETAAAMAASSMVFKSTDPSYAAELLSHAKQLYNFADSTKGSDGTDTAYSNCITDAQSFYNSTYGVYWDELAWGAIWMWRATGDDAYLEKAKTYYDKMGFENQSTTPVYSWSFGWNDKAYAVYVLMAALVGDERYHQDAQRYLDHWSVGQGARSGNGLILVDSWGVNRYAANAGYLALYYADQLGADHPLYDRYHNFGKKQIDHILGDNPGNQSYVVGFGEKFPTNVHHRGSHGSWSDSIKTPEQQRHILYGAVVGGPQGDTGYDEDREDYVLNEVATDYNSGFTSAVAALFDHYGGDALSDFPPEEPKMVEYLVGAKVNSSSSKYIEIKAVIQNHSTQPARGNDDLYIRYWYDLSEVFEAGYSIDDVFLSSGYNQGSAIKGPIHWSGNIYYAQVEFFDDVVFPGGQSEHRRETQFRMGVADTVNVTWNNENDPSFDDSYSTTSETYGIDAPKIAMYDANGLVWGSEPGQSTVSSSSSVSSVVSSSSSSVISSSSSVQSSSSSSAISSSSSVQSSSSSVQSSSSVISSSSSSPGDIGQCVDMCKWYQDEPRPLCENQNSGWGYENGGSCIGINTCASQSGSGGVIAVCSGAVSSSSSSSSSAVSSSSSAYSSAVSSSSSSEPTTTGDVTCEVSHMNQWGAGYQLDVTITNNSGTAISGWTLELDFGTAANITNSWNATVTESPNTVTASNIGWNGNLGAGQSTSFGMQGASNGSLDTPVCTVK